MNSLVNDYVWYLGYGSNICKGRFYCYIKGRKWPLGGSETKGCDVQTEPIENHSFEINHELYFGYKSSSWDFGGVAFIKPTFHNSKKTKARIWKILYSQYAQIKELEGITLYDKELIVGEYEGLPIYTITSSNDKNVNPPSDKYLKTIMIGLAEIGLTSNEIISYLYEQTGTKRSKSDLENILNSFNDYELFESKL